MPYYEIVFETGTRSVAQYADDEEMLAAVGAQHNRATSGQSGGPPGHPAERISRVEKYESHPNDLNPDQVMSADVMKAELDQAVQDSSEEGSVSVPAMVVAVRGLTSPLKDEPGPQDSMFKMESVQTFTEGWTT
jgi:hypothetical protein